MRYIASSPSFPSAAGILPPPDARQFSPKPYLSCNSENVEDQAQSSYSARYGVQKEMVGMLLL